MEPNMAQPGREKYRDISHCGLRVVRGAYYAKRSVYDVDLEAWLDRELGDWFVRCVDADGDVPTEGISDARLGKQHPGRVLGRRVREAVIANVDDEVLDELPFVWRRYVQRCREVLRHAPMQRASA
jgi:hypothetical protein